MTTNAHKLVDADGISPGGTCRVDAIALRRALDRFESISTSLNSLRDLLVPDDGFQDVDRSDLSMLLYYVKVEWVQDHPDNTEFAELADSAVFAICDLLTPSHDLKDVSRDRLCSLIDLFARMHAEAIREIEAVAFASDAAKGKRS